MRYLDVAFDFAIVHVSNIVVVFSPRVDCGVFDPRLI